MSAYQLFEFIANTFPTETMKETENCPLAPAAAVARLHGGRSAVIAKYTSHRSREKLYRSNRGSRGMLSITWALWCKHNAATGYALLPAAPEHLPKGCTIPRSVPRDLAPRLNSFS